MLLIEPVTKNNENFIGLKKYQIIFNIFLKITHQLILC